MRVPIDLEVIEHPLHLPPAEGTDDAVDAPPSVVASAVARAIAIAVARKRPDVEIHGARRIRRRAHAECIIARLEVDDDGSVVFAERAGAGDVDLPDDRAAICENEAVQRWIAEEIIEVNEGFSKHERIKEFRLVGEEWTPMIPVLQIVALYGLLSSFTHTSKALWQAIGHPEYYTKLSALRLVLMAVLVYPAATRYGIVGVAALVLGVHLVPTIPITVWLVVESVDGSYRRLLREVSYPFAASAAMGAVTLSVRERVVLEAGVLGLLLLVVVGVVSYVGLTLLLVAVSDWGLGRNFRRALAAFQR